MADDVKLIEQANAALRERLSISKELLELNNRTASSTDETYSKQRMIAEQRQLAYETTQAQVDLMLQTTEQQEQELARLQALGEERTTQNDSEMQMLEEILRMRREEPALLDQSIQKLRAKAAAQREGATAAEDQRKFVEEEAAAWGKNLANAMGFRKEQDSILKKFMKSKNKIKAMTNAMKAFVSQISLAQIGTKIMQSGFQMLTGVLTRLFGRRGGGGGANIHQFVKMTGHANDGLSRMAKSAGRLGKKLKVGFDEGAKAVGHMMDGVTGFMTMSKKSQKTLSTLAVKMSAFNVEAELSATVLDQLMTRWGQSAKGAKKSMMNMFGAAKKLGIPISKYVEDFSEFARSVPSDGRNIERRFRDMAAAAKAVGVAVKTMLDLAKGFETFEDATRGAAQMNQILGKAVFNNMELMKAANESPEKFADKMQEGLKRAGKSWNDLSIYQKKAMAKSAKMDIGEMEKLMGGAKGDPVSRVQKARKSVNSITAAVKEFNQALKRTKPPGGGGGKDFFSMVLKEYNEITGGKFFRKLRVARGNLKDVIKAVARFVACWIRKIEKWFINAATSFVDAWSGAINWVGNLFGVNDLASKMKEWIGMIDGWGPVLIPVLAIVAGALVRIGGLALGLVTTFGKLAWAMGKGLIKGIANLPALLGGIRDRFAGIKDAIMDPKGGTIFERMKRGWGALMGHTDSTNLAALQRQAQPVHIVAPNDGGVIPVSSGSGSMLENLAETAANTTSITGRGPRGKGLRFGKASLWNRSKARMRGMRKGWGYGKRTGIGRFRGMALKGREFSERATVRHQVGQMKRAGFSGRQISSMYKTGAMGSRGVGGIHALPGQPGSIVDTTRSKFNRAPKPGALTKYGSRVAHLERTGTLLPRGVTSMGPHSPIGGFEHVDDFKAVKQPGRIGTAWNKATALGGRASQTMSRIPGWQGLTKVLGPVAKTLGRVVGPVGVALGAFEGISNITKGVSKGDWGSIAEGVTDIGMTVAMFAFPVGTVAAAAWGLVKAFGLTEKYAKSARLTEESVAEHRTDWMKRHVEEEKHRYRELQNLHKVITANLISTGGSDKAKQHFGVDSGARVALEESIRKKYKTDEMAELGKTATGGLGSLRNVVTDSHKYAKSWEDAGEDGKGNLGYGDLFQGGKYYDESNYDNILMAENKINKALKNYQKHSNELFKGHKKAAAANLEKVKKIPILDATPLTKAEQELLDKKMDDTKWYKDRLHETSAAIRQTDAYKDPPSSTGTFEKVERELLLSAGRIDVQNERQIRKKYKEAEALVIIAQNRVTAAAGNLTDQMFNDFMSRTDLATAEIDDVFYNVYNRLTNRESAGALDALGKQRLKQMQVNLNQVNALSDLSLTAMGSLEHLSGGKNWGNTIGIEGHSFNVLDDSGQVKKTGEARKYAQLWQKEVAAGQRKIDPAFAQQILSEQGEVMQIVQKNILGNLKEAPVIAEQAMAKLRKQAETDPSLALNQDNIMKTIIETMKVHTGDKTMTLEKFLKGRDQQKVKTLEERAAGFAESGFKVTKKDIENFASYEKALNGFIKFAESGDIKSKLDPVIKAVDQLKIAGSDEVAGKFYYGMATFFYHASHLKSGHAKAIDKIGTALKLMTKKITPEEMSTIGTALQQLTTSPTGEGAKTAIAEATAALAAWQKVAKHVDDFTNDVNKGALFFKGGTIKQEVNSKMDVKLVVGGKEFGKATLEGLKQAGAISNVKAKPQFARK